MSQNRLVLSVIIAGMMPLICAGAIFMQIDGIAGESIDSNHHDWIDVTNFSHHVTWGGGQSVHGPLVVEFTMDKSAPTLNIRACDQHNIAQLKLDVTQDGDTSKWIYQLELYDVKVQSVSTSGDTGAPQVNAEFSFGRIRWKYRTYDSGGMPAGDVEAGWNVTNNVSW